MSFGTARWIENDTVGFTADAELDPGEKAEIRLELPGLTETVLANVVVTGVRRDVRSRSFQYSAQIRSMPPGDQDTLEQWIVRNSFGSSGFGTDSRTVSQESSAVSRSTGRRKNPHGPRDASRSSQTWAPGSSVSNTGTRGRARINKALLQRLDIPAGDPSRQSTPSVNHSVSSSLYSTASVVATESQFDPQVRWNEGEARATVTWKDPQNLIHDWQTYLCNKALPLPMEKPHPKRGTELALRLKLPDGQMVTVRARVSGRSGRTVLCTVELSATAKANLRQAVRAAELADRD